MSDRDTKIRQRAHQIWEEEGRPSGRDRDHWERASREIDDEDATPVVSDQSHATTDKSATGSEGPAKPARKRRTKK